MYDAVTLWIERKGALRVLDRLDSVQEHADTSTGEVTYSGTLSNLRLFCDAGRFKVSGSLPKYLHGTNSATLTRHDTEAALDHLSARLDAPMTTARVSAFEFGSSIELTAPVSEYLRQLGEARRYRRSVLRMKGGEGLYYTNGLRELAFYDKGKELEKKERQPQSDTERANLLRYEIRFRRKLASQLPATSITGATLTDAEFYGHLVEYWRDQYFAIERNRVTRPTGLSSWGVRQLKDYLAACGIVAQGGTEAVGEMLRSAKESGAIEKSQYQRMRAAVRELTSSAELTAESETLQELNTRITETAHRFREGEAHNN